MNILVQADGTLDAVLVANREDKHGVQDLLMEYMKKKAPLRGFCFAVSTNPPSMRGSTQHTHMRRLSVLYSSQMAAHTGELRTPP